MNLNSPKIMNEDNIKKIDNYGKEILKKTVAEFSKKGGMPGNLTPFTRSSQKHAGQLIKASILERLTS